MRRCKACQKEIPTASKSTEIYHKKKFCSWDCLTSYAKTKAAYEKGVKAKSKLSAKKVKAKSDSALVIAQKAVNAFIRLRDIHKPCISCGAVGKPSDAGHYHSVGARPNLRFNTLNISGQCQGCNRGAAEQYSRSHDVTRRYREKLIERIGLERVESLDLDHDPRHYTKADLERIAVIFRKKLRLYKKLFR